MSRYFAVAAIAALPLLASCSRVVPDPSHLELQSGQEATIAVHEEYSGSPYPGSPRAVTFTSSNPAVATVDGSIMGPPWASTILVHALLPGTAVVIGANATVEVYSCDGDLPDVGELHRYVVAPVGTVAVLAVNATTSTASTTYSWFLGESGDRSHPIPAPGGGRLWLPVEHATPYRIWVEVNERCGTKTVQFTIAPQPRRRAG